ncbi:MULTISPECIES: sodium:alanine symporter family protein [unclassified Lentimicrobium]|uniref:alanine/glycine:cation symporter family protein n=1 Tax=unclassified Lentimicrobium TaxID=2677434 RepID=UPI001C12D6FF|nr:MULTISPECIES: alanine/glycine:cation symporter family protein [unclassified Lentimicrobium]
MSIKKLSLIVSFVFVFLAGSWAHASEKKPVEEQTKTTSEHINDFFEPIVEQMNTILFFDPFEWAGIYDPIIYDDEGAVVIGEDGKPIKAPLPIIVVWLIIGAVIFTVYMGFINIRGFKHAIQIVSGKYDNPNDAGEVSHFQALTTALSGTVGLGNIAGVAIAIVIGGPGATFWMIIAGLLGMSSKFVECTLGVKYRKIDVLGQVSGGPMYYLYMGLKKRKMKGLGAVLSVIFSILVIGGSFGGGNMFQANQAFAQFSSMIPALEGHGFWFGLVLALLVGMVIIGGIKSIAKVTDKIVPLMAVMYVGIALIIIFMNISHVGEAFRLIFEGAFDGDAMKGGVIGVLIVGFQRASFSNEAGAGSAAIAHSAVKTKEPITEGLVALLEPFVDTVVICTMTALVIIFTGFYTNPDNLQGTELTSQAFASVFTWFPYVLVVAIFLFAFSTMISWSYYGLKGFDYLFGGLSERYLGSRKYSDTVYRLMFLSFIVIGASSTLGAVVDFSDMMILSMGFPNIIGLLILAPEVKKDLKDYLRRVKSGEIKAYK